MTSQTSSTAAILPRSHLPPAEVPCKFFQQGYCARAEKCWYKHDVQTASSHLSRTVKDRRRQAAVNTSDPSSPSGAKGESGNTGMKVFMTSAAREKAKNERKEPVQPEETESPRPATPVEHTCSICYEKPITFGLLEKCNHVFCLECIRTWRGTTSTEPSYHNDNASRTCRTCPLCRVTSSFIIPSSIHPSSSHKETESDPKNIIIDNYLSKMKTIPCRYFQDSLKPLNGSSGGPPLRLKPRCKFGNQCHYAHTLPETGHPYIFSDREIRDIRRSTMHASRFGRVNNNHVLETLQSMMNHVGMEPQSVDGYDHHIAQDFSYAHNMLEDLWVRFREELHIQHPDEFYDEWLHHLGEDVYMADADD